SGWSASQKKPRRNAGAFAVRKRLFQRPEPVVYILVDLILGEAVALLQLAFELFTPAFDDVEIVVGELAPLLLGLALELLPIAFDAVPIHCNLLCDEKILKTDGRHRRSSGTDAAS